MTSTSTSTSNEARFVTCTACGATKHSDFPCEKCPAKRGDLVRLQSCPGLLWEVVEVREAYDGTTRLVVRRGTELFGPITRRTVLTSQLTPGSPGSTAVTGLQHSAGRRDGKDLDAVPYGC